VRQSVVKYLAGAQRENSGKGGGEIKIHLFLISEPDGDERSVPLKKEYFLHVNKMMYANSVCTLHSVLWAA
jgi:hypothetical protein